MLGGENKMTFEEAFEILCSELGDEFNWEFISFTKKSFCNHAKKDIKEDHPLYGKILHSIARCTSNDDVLFVTSDEQGGNLYIIIHLTYSNNSCLNFPRFITLGGTDGMMDYLRKNFKEQML